MASDSRKNQLHSWVVNKKQCGERVRDTLGHRGRFGEEQKHNAFSEDIPRVCNGPRVIMLINYVLRCSVSSEC